MKRALIIIFTTIFLQGCVGLGHKDFYTQVAPTKYPPPVKVVVFEYENVNLKEVYEMLFQDFLVIGRSGFNGPYQDPKRSASYAQSIGADVLLSTSQFKEARTSFINSSTPTTNTTFISGYSGTGSFYGTATTYGTRTTTVPVTVNRYDQDGLFLRNINKVVPLWERTVAQYKKTEFNELEGNWSNETYKLNIYRSGQQLVAFIASEPKVEGWAKDQLKFISGVDSKVGVYLMGDKTPMPAHFKLNKFGHLEVELITLKETFSFAR